MFCQLDDQLPFFIDLFYDPTIHQNGSESGTRIEAPDERE
jgi:hypothetical protein